LSTADGRLDVTKLGEPDSHAMPIDKAISTDADHSLKGCESLHCGVNACVLVQCTQASVTERAFISLSEIPALVISLSS
jgi:hypothetical protein